MTRVLAPLRVAALLFLLLAVGGAYANRELLASATPRDLLIIVTCLFLPFIPLLLTPILLPFKERNSVDF